jgi:MtN3 and saliva related transmembrane protein
MDVGTITFAAIIGILTVMIGILVKVIGFPDQFRLNHKRKSTKGLSTLLYVLSFVSYILWTLHGILQKDWVLIIGQGVGIITTAMIVIQIYIYRKNK